MRGMLAEKVGKEKGKLRDGVYLSKSFGTRNKKRGNENWHVTSIHEA